MTEKTAISVDPILSDGSEESWILLDEMDEAMNEDFNAAHHSTDENDAADHSNTSTEENVQPKLIETEAGDAEITEKEDAATIETAEDAANIETNSEAISACPSEDEEIDNATNQRR